MSDCSKGGWLVDMKGMLTVEMLLALQNKLKLWMEARTV